MNGELFAGSWVINVLHHSSFQKGGYVIYGGTMTVRDGVLKYVDDYSGHYTPRIHQFFNMLREFKSRGLIQPDTIIKKKYPIHE